MMNRQLLSCDWGTSSFRLRLVDPLSGDVLGEVLSPTGVAATFDAWKTEQERSGVQRIDFFCHFLQQRIDELERLLALPLDGLPVVLSGMASSSIGMAELPYASLPFPLDGGQVKVRWLAARPGFPHRLLLISGVRSLQDVMRGEETQLIGLSEQLPPGKPCVLVFPGTHSKHMYVEQGQMTDFRTFMTGEVFSALVHHTILKESTNPTDLALRLGQDPLSFQKGVLASESANLLGNLFTIRTNQLFERLDRSQNALYLSGLLIGTELQELRRKPDWQLVLCCDNNLVDFYTQAIDFLDLTERTITIAPAQIRHAAITGHLRIINYQLALTDATQ